MYRFCSIGQPETRRITPRSCTSRETAIVKVLSSGQCSPSACNATRTQQCHMQLLLVGSSLTARMKTPCDGALLREAGLGPERKEHWQGGGSCTDGARDPYLEGAIAEFRAAVESEGRERSICPHHL